MIDAKDLRIGNWVMGIYKPTQIVGIDLTSEFVGCLAIELTEDILLKCGFERHSTNHFWFRYGFFCISILGYVELISWDMKVFKIDVKITYLHELQNVIFALTQKELTVQL